MIPFLTPFPLAFRVDRTLRRIQKALPDDEMFMGVGNLTELTEADSTGINAILLGICAELEINYVLTTEVTSWARVQ